MAIEVKFRSEDKNLRAVDHIYSGCAKPSALKGIHGFYVFTLGNKCLNMFQKAGVYTFSLSLVSMMLKLPIVMLSFKYSILNFVI